MSRRSILLQATLPPCRKLCIKSRTLSSIASMLSLLFLLVPAHTAQTRWHMASAIRWPDDQVLPHFCCITGPLDMINIIKLNNEQNLLFTSLEGLVNRTQPRIYVQQRTREKPLLWLHEMHVAVNPVNDPYDLISKYRSEITGTIIYNPTVPATINLATTIAGTTKALIVSPSEAARLALAPYNLPVQVDLRTQKFASAQAIYQYTYNRYWSQPQAEHRLLIGLPPGPSGLRDYAIATGAAVVWLDAGNTSDPEQKTLLDAFYRSMPAGSSYVGWYPNEDAGVQEASTFGIASYAADLALNLTILGAGNHTINHPSLDARPQPVLKNKLYVTMFMSDGDNIQIDQHLLATKWADPQRGRVPIGWTINPALVDMAPAILNYYWRTATPNDELVAGPSGLGYVVTDQLPNAALNTYVQQSASYMRQAGVDIATVWNTPNGMRRRVGNAYAQADGDILGITTQNRLRIDRTGPRVYNHTFYSLPMAVPYADSISELIATIAKAAKGYNSKMGPRFLPLQANLNKPTITPSTLYKVQQTFKTNANIVFVGPEELFRLFARSHAR